MKYFLMMLLAFSASANTDRATAGPSYAESLNLPINETQFLRYRYQVAGDPGKCTAIVIETPKHLTAKQSARVKKAFQAQGEAFCEISTGCTVCTPIEIKELKK